MTGPWVEITLRRLLKKCEQMAKENNAEDEWRLQKYVEFLETSYDELNTSDALKPLKDDLDTYRRKIEYLKGLVEARKIIKLSEDRRCIMTAQKTSGIPVQLMRPSTKDSEMEEIYQELLVRCEKEARNELFHRKSAATKPNSEFQTDDSTIWEKDALSHQILSIARNMKEQSELAGKIIRQDNKVLEKSKDVLERNQEHLGKQNSRLMEFISKSSWNCLVWVMLAVMVIVFINMVLFMKVNKKRY